MAIPASAYANLTLVQPRPAAKPTAPARQREAIAQRDRELQLKRKIDQANAILNRLEARGLALAVVIKRLQRRKNAAAARIERIEDQILNQMLAAGIDKAAGLEATFTTRANAASLLIDDETLIPDVYVRETLVSAPDKLAIKAAMALGEEVPGCHLEQSVSLIRK